MKRTVVIALVSLFAAAGGVLAQQPQEESQKTTRTYTIEEVRAELDRIERMPKVVTIDPYEARSAARELIDNATDEEIAFFYGALVRAKKERDDFMRRSENIRARVKANRERRERERRVQTEREH